MLWIAKNCLIPEGQEIVENLPLDISYRIDKRRSGDDYETSNPYILYCLENGISASKMGWTPHLNCFPKFEVVKESKMYLTMLDAPLDKVDLLKSKLRKFLSRYSPSKLIKIRPEATIKVGTNLYYDHGDIRKDYERPKNNYSGHMLYQKIHNQPLSYREIWLPSKVYKTMSTFWMNICGQTLKRIPYCAYMETQETLEEKVSKHFVPCRSLDLKGMGLQFPREYISAVHDIFVEMYDDEELHQSAACVRSLFENLTLEETQFVRPRRGTGLGYFEVEKSLIMACLLSEKHVVCMWNDDMLIKEEDYLESRKILEDFSLVINEKKSGILWKNMTFFGGLQIDKSGRSSSVYMAIGFLSAIFTKRRHWLRKAMCADLLPRESRYVAAHLEFLFGYEFKKGDYMLNPRNLGGVAQMPAITGYGRDYLVYKSRVKDENKTIRQTLFLTINPATENAIHFARKEQWKKGIRCWDIPYRWWEPDEVTPRSNSYLHHLTRTTLKVPDWIEDNLILFHGETTLKRGRGLEGQELMNAVLNNVYSQDPWDHEAKGGSIVVGLQVPRAPDNYLLLLAERLMEAIPVDFNFVYKQKLRGDLAVKSRRPINLEVVHDDDESLSDELVAPDEYLPDLGFLDEEDFNYDVEGVIIDDDIDDGWLSE
jgi:hypothetical protein